MQRTVLLTLAFCTAACGAVEADDPAGAPGGNPANGNPPAGSQPGAGSTFGSYAPSALPGRLLANQVQLENLNWESYVFDLGAGGRVALPQSTQASNSAQDWWVSNASGSTLARYEENRDVLTIYDGASMNVRASYRIADMAYPTLSPDGHYLLARWYDHATEYSDESELTVFDLQAGGIVKRGSQQPYGYSRSQTYSWLPDGRYVYLVAKTLYVGVPTQPGSERLVELSGLPEALGEPYFSFSTIAVSPNGARIALTWGEKRLAATRDSNIWIANIDGSGLHRVTTTPDANNPLNFSHGSPTWSPDSRWIAGVRFMSGVIVDEPANRYEDVMIIGTTGCIDDVFVLPADARDISLTWPRWDANLGIRVKDRAGTGAEGLSTCSGDISWLP